MVSKTIASVVWVSLVAVACVELCQASLFRLGGHKMDQLDKLDEFVEGLTRGDELAEKIQAVKGFMDLPAFSEVPDGEFKNAIVWFSQLQPDDKHLCEPENLRLMRNLFDLAGRGGGGERHLRGARRKHRLFQQMQHLLAGAKHSCFQKLEERWLPGLAHRITPAFFDKLDHFGPISARHMFDYGQDALDRDIKHLRGAVRMLKTYQPGDLFSGRDLRSLLAHLNGYLAHRDLANFWQARAASHIDQYLLKPCKLTLEQDASVEILESVLDLGHMLKLDPSIQPAATTRLGVARDAAGYAVCKRLLKMDRLQLINELSNMSR